MNGAIQIPLLATLCPLHASPYLTTSLLDPTPNLTFFEDLHQTLSSFQVWQITNVKFFRRTATFSSHISVFTERRTAVSEEPVGQVPS